MIIYIYALVDPTTNEVRYVGKTKDLNVRMYQHCHPTLKDKSDKANWVRQLIAAGQTPQMLILEECTSQTWRATEQKWITHYCAINQKMTNIRKGGDGRNGEYSKKLSSIGITKNMQVRLMAYAKKEDVAISEIVRRAVEKYLTEFFEADEPAPKP